MMRDFNQWLGDLTSELQEKEDDHSWMADAAPDPCDVCGSAEEVCDCEEEEFRKTDGTPWVHSHDIQHTGSRPGSIKPMEGCIVDVEVMHKASESLRRELLERRVAVFQQQMEAPLEYLREGHNMTATEVMEHQREASLRIRRTDHELARYAVQFLQDMLRRAEREGGDS